MQRHGDGAGYHQQAPADRHYSGLHPGPATAHGGSPAARPQHTRPPQVSHLEMYIYRLARCLLRTFF